MTEDITLAYKVSGSLWKCMIASLPPMKFRPLKYYSTSGKPSEGYGRIISFLANLNGEDVLVKRWGLESWKVYVDEIWRTKYALIEKENEYRSLAIIIVQIGIGIGGMLIGLLGLFLAILTGLL